MASQEVIEPIDLPGQRHLGLWQRLARVKGKGNAMHETLRPVWGLEPDVELEFGSASRAGVVRISLILKYCLRGENVVGWKTLQTPDLFPEFLKTPNRPGLRSFVNLTSDGF
jgi:hypothetical protein